MCSRLPLAVLITLALAGAVPVEGLERNEISADELLAGTALGVPPGVSAPVADEQVLAVTAEMRAFLDEHVHRKAADQVRLHELIDALINTKAFALEFDDRTRTASEAFERRTGNCLSFSNLFVALAREVELRASFQEVDLPPDWSLDKDVFVLNRHVNVRVDLDPLSDHVVDFNIDDFRASYETREISDDRARAHYFNNMGVEAMQAGDAATAAAYFRKALADNDREFSPAWTNLGTLYLRLGHPAHAEAAYLQALKVDRDEVVAMSNLASLYERQGDTKRAAVYRKRVVHHRQQNPYYRFQRALEAYGAGEWDAAISHLKFAARKKPHEVSFADLMARCYLGKGDARAAARWQARTDELAAAGAPSRRHARTPDSPPPDAD
jgi:tetratricopeptide (TPR) repeat protein